MRPLRLLLAMTGAGALLVGGPVCARETAPVGDGPTSATGQNRALSLLDAAARAARSRSWSGTQYIATHRSGTVTTSTLAVTHLAGQGRTVRVLAGSADERGGAVSADVLDATLLGLLASRYDLVVSGQAWCAGYPAHLVEVRRPSVAGAAGVAGRFWIDTGSGLVMRRDVYDESGALVRSSAFVDLKISPSSPAGKPVEAAYSGTPVLRPGGHQLGTEALSGLEDDGWPVQRNLPGGLELFDARMHDSQGGEVLQLAYSDGLSTLSLFVQPGQAPALSGVHSRSVKGGTVWHDPAVPERLVWSGSGRTWTLVSDASQSTVDAAVEVLPHGEPPQGSEGVPARTWRGMSRVGSWLNPFS